MLISSTTRHNDLAYSPMSNLVWNNYRRGPQQEQGEEDWLSASVVNDGLVLPNPTTRPPDHLALTCRTAHEHTAESLSDGTRPVPCKPTQVEVHHIGAARALWTWRATSINL